MKKYISVLFTFTLIISFVKTNAQWSANGTHIYNNNSGYVGIGLGSSLIPTSPLTVFSELGLTNSGNSTAIKGNVTSATSLVTANFNILANTSAINGPYITMWLKDNNSTFNNGNIDLTSFGADGNGLVVGNYNPTTTSWSKALIVKKTGQVAIGLEWPDLSYKLSVCGKIRAQEIKVETGWCDYVFKKDYKLMPFTQLKTFINTNYRLPEIPTQQEVEKEGISLGNMQMLQMKK